METLKVLFLSAWYPNREDQMFGLFVRKHAEAVARKANVFTLYLCADGAINKTEIVEQETNGVKEIYVYYPFIDIPLIRPLTKTLYYIYSYSKGYKYFSEKYGRQDVTQANILTRSGVLAYWMKLRHGIPYVIVEHWSRYLPQNNSYKGTFRKIMTRLSVRKANYVLAVTENLREAMQSHGLRNKNFGLINNVVDDFFYDNEPKANLCAMKFQFIYISCFDERPKNVLGLLNGIKALSQKRDDFELTLVGTGKDWKQATDYASKIGLSDEIVHFVGEKSPQEVKEYLTLSDAMLLFSNYENAPVVISEALAIGIPVIATNVGGIPEMINEECGILIQPKDEVALINAMDSMICNKQKYNAKKIQKNAEKYRYENVANFLIDIYNKII